MGRPGNMAFRSRRALLVLGVCTAVAFHCAVAVSHNVGGVTGWTVPSGNSFYDNWAANTTLKVGDTLVFNFSTNTHNVLRVNKPDYDNCTATSPLKSYTTGPATANLTESGPHYYICGVPGHCTAGQKLAITVWLSARSEASPSPQSSATIKVLTAPMMIVEASPQSSPMITRNQTASIIVINHPRIWLSPRYRFQTPSSSPSTSPSSSWPSFQTPSSSPWPSPSSLLWPSFQTPSAVATSYIVGGSNGWIVPSSSSNKLYDNWAANITFKVGDSLGVQTQSHNALLV